VGVESCGDGGYPCRGGPQGLRGVVRNGHDDSALGCHEGNAEEVEEGVCRGRGSWSDLSFYHRCDHLGVVQAGEPHP
jgi:hypothetical protein